MNEKIALIELHHKKMEELTSKFADICSSIAEFKDEMRLYRDALLSWQVDEMQKYLKEKQEAQ